MTSSTELAAAIAAAEAGDWEARVGACGVLAAYAERDDVAGLLVGLVLDAGDTAVTDAAAEALLVRGDTVAVRLFARALGGAEGEQFDHLHGAVVERQPGEALLRVSAELRRDPEVAVRDGARLLFNWVMPWVPSGGMTLRNVGLGDVDAYVRMRCDPVMMADLGGPLPVEGMADKVHRDAELASTDHAWLKMIIQDRAVAGSLALWRHSDHGDEIAEIGWMVLPEFQGRGIGKRAVGLLLDRARGDDRWASVHAFPNVTNGPSNGICRSLGFRLLGEEEYEFAGHPLRVNHWVIDPEKDLKIPERV